MERLDGVNGVATLGRHAELQDAGMIEAGSNPSPHRVRETLGGADGLEQTRSKAAAERFVEDFDDVVVGILARRTQPDHSDVALIDVLFRNEVVTRFRGGELDPWLARLWSFRPITESLTELGFHAGGIEVADHADDDVVGMSVLRVPVDQVLTGDGVDGRVFFLARVRILRTVGEFYRLAAGDLGGFVVAAGDGVEGF